MMPAPELETLAAALDARLTPPARDWLADRRRDVSADPDAIAAIFPAVGRAIGRAPLDPVADARDVHAWTLDDAGRTVLLHALQAHATAQLPALYRHGDAAERRGVLRALAYLDAPDRATCLALVADALRSNDVRLIAAALGPYALAYLDDRQLADGVLKCVFSGVPLAGLHGLERRATPALAAMLARYVHERVAAGRMVPADVWPLIEAHPPAAELAAIEAELAHPAPDRRRVARAALADRHARPGEPTCGSSTLTST